MPCGNTGVRNGTMNEGDTSWGGSGLRDFRSEIHMSHVNMTFIQRLFALRYGSQVRFSGTVLRALVCGAVVRRKREADWYQAVWRLAPSLSLVFSPVGLYLIGPTSVAALVADVRLAGPSRRTVMAGLGW